MSEGREGMTEMLVRMVRLARRIAEFIRDSDDYEWLPQPDASLEHTHIIVLFRARDPQLNSHLVQRINQTRRIYVSGTSWRGEKACRIAVGSWRVDVEEDFAVVREVLTSVTRNSE
jgi:glutamate/tyrosine decarboxylase-like PLP-dependent enzyme